MAGARASTLPPLLLGAALLAAILGLDGPVPSKPMREPAPEESAASPPVALRRIALPSPPTPHATASANTAAPELPAVQPAPPAPDPTPPGQVSPPAMPAVHPTAADAGRGRLLLDRIEKGEGPSIEIGWPDDPAARQRLARHLARCAGWRPLLLADGRLWRLEDQAGQPWTPAAGASPSGFLRDLGGSAADAGTIAAIRARHRLLAGTPVAAVDRGWDARLLGGIARGLGAGWDGRGRVRARYVVAGGRLTVADLQLDGRAVQGGVDLGPVDRCGG